MSTFTSIKSFDLRLLGAVVIRLYPSLSSAAGTDFLNHGQLLNGVEDAAWYEQNVPFLDVPNTQIQQVYYYRLQTYKEHLVYTGAQYGYLSSEFLQPVSYGAPYGGINAAAGHHIIEGRWLRDQTYGKDIVNYWLAGPGQFKKPMRDELDNLVKQYRGRDGHFNANLGLYWQVPVWDATECTAASYESSDPYHGGAGYRPTINAFQYGDARAIASIAGLSGRTALADEYSRRADALQTSIKQYLWDNQTQFFKHRHRDNNPNGQLLTTREYMGYVPWMFNMPQATSDMPAFAQLKDSQGFASPYGPTTAERRSRWFMTTGANCLQWNGPSWPYATSQVLTAVEKLLHDYPAQSTISATDYFALLLGYAAAQYKNGKPYIAEAHDSDANKWMYDNPNHSEDYNHSTFIDNIIAGLLGLRAQPDNTLKINPLVPSNWDYFAIKNVAYHGHTLTLLYEKLGARYNQGPGLKVYINGNLPLSPLINIAANPQRFPLSTLPFASYTSPHDSPWRAIDGLIFRTAVPQNSRWTSYNSPNPLDHFGVDLRRPQSISTITLYFYSDSSGVRLPPSYNVQYLLPNTTPATWLDIPNQTRSPPSLSSSNTQTTITFPPLLTSQIRIQAPNPGPSLGWGLSELQIWTSPVFQIQNHNSGKLIGVENMSTSLSANIQQYEDNGTRDHLWEFIKSGSWVKIRNVNSGLLLGVEGMSKALGVKLQQYEDNGTEDHLWRVVQKSENADVSGGLFLLVNKNSGLVVGVDGESRGNGALVVQFEDNGTGDHLWNLLSAAV